MHNCWLANIAWDLLVRKFISLCYPNEISLILFGVPLHTPTKIRILALYSVCKHKK